MILAHFRCRNMMGQPDEQEPAFSGLFSTLTRHAGITSDAHQIAGRHDMLIMTPPCLFIRMRAEATSAPQRPPGAAIIILARRLRTLMPASRQRLAPPYWLSATAGDNDAFPLYTWKICRQARPPESHVAGVRIGLLYISRLFTESTPAAARAI